MLGLGNGGGTILYLALLVVGCEIDQEGASKGLRLTVSMGLCFFYQNLIYSQLKQ